MSFTEAVQRVYRKYATFEGRAPRSEFWWFQLFYLLVGLGSYAVIFALLIATRSMAAAGIGFMFVFVFGLVSVIPNLAVLVRRLHDTDRPGWWFWIGLIPWVGFIILIVFLAQEGTRGYNRYGPPEGQPAADAYAEYTGWTRADALARFSEDAQRAAGSGYYPVTQDWEQRGNVEVLRVWYSRQAAAGWPAAPGAGTAPGGGLG